MTVITLLDSIAMWAQTEICDRLLFKQAPRVDSKTDEGYEYKLVHPTASVMYLPTECSPTTATYMRDIVPACVVQVEHLSFDIAAGKTTARIILMFAVWSPGEYVKDTLIPQQPDGARLPDILAYKESDAQTIAGKPRGFLPDNTGWRDAYTFLQAGIDALYRTDAIGGIIIKKSEKADADPYTENGAITNFYPYFYTHLDFTVEVDELPTSSDEVEKFL